MLANAEELSRLTRSALGVRNLFGLRGFWRLECGDFESAKASLLEAVALANKAGKRDRRSEIRLVLARLRLGELPDPTQAARQCAENAEDSCHRALADLWLAIGERERAAWHAIRAYGWAWADGAPYVRLYELRKSEVLLEQLGVQSPALSPYDRRSDRSLPWESDVVKAIETLKADADARRARQESPARQRSAERCCRL
jgi:hypothetical protein